MKHPILQPQKMQADHKKRMHGVRISDQERNRGARFASKACPFCCFNEEFFVFLKINIFLEPGVPGLSLDKAVKT